MAQIADSVTVGVLVTCTTEYGHKNISFKYRSSRRGSAGHLPCQETCAAGMQIRCSSHLFEAFFAAMTSE